MRNITKLLPILLLGSTLSGCSLLGFGDSSSNDLSQFERAQASQYQGASSYCPQQATCNSVPAAATYQAPGYAQSAPVAAPQAYSQPAQNYYGSTGQQASQAQSIYQGQQAYQGQPVYQGQQAYQGQPVYQGQQAYQGQPTYSQNGYGTSPYVSPRARASKSLRPAYFYGELGATLYDVDSDIYGAQARVGYQSSYFIGAEVEGSLGFTNDNSSFNNGAGITAASTDIENQIAGFGVLRYPATKQINVLGRFGYHNTEGEINLDDGVTQTSTNISEDGIAYGAGIEYAVTDNMGVRVDYTRYQFDGPDADAVSLAVTRKF